MKVAGTYPGTKTCEGNPETRWRSTEVCFSFLFRHAGPIGPLAPSGDGICGSEGTGRETKESRHTMLREMGFPVFVLADPEEIPSILDKITRAQDGKGGEAQ